MNQETERLTVNNVNYIKVVKLDDWIIGYYPGEPPFADFHRRPPNGHRMPYAVMSYHCGICKADDQRPCEHIKALEANAPSVAEPDIDGRREAYYQAGQFPPNPIY